MSLSAADRLLRRAALAVGRLPAGLARALAGSPRVNHRGDRLDPHLQLLLRLEGLARMDKRSSVAAARTATARGIALVEAPPRQVARVETLTLAPGIGARLYAPVGRAPVLVYLHGGGWVTGDLDSHDAFCRRLAAEAGWLVVAVDYPRAPEHPFPAAVDAALAAWRDVARRAAALGGDPQRLAIGGDSAGGTLAAVTCLLLRDAGEPQPARQVLVYPATELHCRQASHQEFAHGYQLTAEDIGWYRAHYAAPDWDDPRASPLLAASHAGLAPATVVTAGFDPLRDEGEAYVAALRQAGVGVDHLAFGDLVHGFLHMDGAIPAADRAVRSIVARVAAA